MTRIALYAGSFDPLTLGHLHVIRAAARLCDTLVVAIGVHPTKTPLLDIGERTALLRSEAEPLARTANCALSVRSFEGLTVDVARQCGATVIIRGLRSASDFDAEMAMAGMNRQLAPEVETVFVPASPETRHITATLVRQIAAMGGNVAPFVPTGVATALRSRLQGR